MQLGVLFPRQMGHRDITKMIHPTALNRTGFIESKLIQNVDRVIKYTGN